MPNWTMSAGFTTKSQHSGKRRWWRNWSDIARTWPSPKGNNFRRATSAMASESSIRRHRNCYTKLLRLYPRPYRERFGEGMEQTFNDLCRERIEAGKSLFSFALWTFFETFAGIIRENAAGIVRCSMNRGSTIFLRLVLSLIAIAAL